MADHRDIRRFAEAVIAGDMDALAPLLDLLHDQNATLWAAMVSRIGAIYARVMSTDDDHHHERSPAGVRADIIGSVRQCCWPYIDGPGAVMLLTRIAAQDHARWQERHKAAVEEENRWHRAERGW